ncbi:hypothetical protein A5889_001949 [Enterococcus sp. 9D6_DIV0238]|uniref:Uncharacterized protein n=1 Tax=Candidatus Enterococcus dunnyi TaxID=1834192 RepID=A0A200J0J2_9ENTE|nr:hypothetical protein A5889_002629 [Enterococcus sp. 9D6_DIV0238]
MSPMYNWLTLLFFMVALFFLYSYLFVGHAIQSLISAVILLLACVYRLIKRYQNN